MKIVYSDNFVKQFRKLPANIQALYRKQEVIFLADIFDPRLHGKKLKDLGNAYSFRVTRGYRVLFAYIDDSTILFTTIEHRKDVYR